MITNYYYLIWVKVAWRLSISNFELSGSIIIIISEINNLKTFEFSLDWWIQIHCYSDSKLLAEPNHPWWRPYVLLSRQIHIWCTNWMNSGDRGPVTALQLNNDNLFLKKLKFIKYLLNSIISLISLISLMNSHIC